jgi:hypothetical protein
MALDGGLDPAEIRSKAGDRILPHGCGIAFDRHLKITLSRIGNGGPQRGIHVIRRLAGLRTSVPGQECQKDNCHAVQQVEAPRDRSHKIPAFVSENCTALAWTMRALVGRY